jgi:8-oxo-dGTP pyrophosphatase MutT (NUDIX family)
MNGPFPTPAHATQAPPPTGRLPRLTVATVVPDGGRFLFVEERIRGRLVVNQPAGHLEPDETLAEAAVRETREETGWQVEITDLLAVYHWPSPPDRRPVLRFTFLARPLSHDPAQPLDSGIERALWLPRDELESGNYRHRSPLVARSVDDYLAGQRAPLSLLASISG